MVASAWAFDMLSSLSMGSTKKMQGELGCQGPMAEDDSRRSLEKAYCRD